MEDLFKNYFINSPERALLLDLTIKNYRGFNEAVTVKNKPLTMLFGGNSAGKSSLLRLFNYLENAAKTRSWNINDSTNIKDLVYQKTEDNTLTLEFSVWHHFESTLEFEGETIHKAKYSVLVELELRSIEKSIDNILFMKRDIFGPTQGEGLNREERIKNREKYISENFILNDLNKYDFVERRVCIDELIFGSNTNESRRIVDLYFKVDDGEIYVKSGFINPYTPLSLIDLAFSDSGNMRRRIGNNVNNIAEKYINSFIEFCSLVNDLDFEEDELRRVGYKNLELIKAYGDVDKLYEQTQYRIGTGLFGAFDAFLNQLSTTLGFSGIREHSIRFDGRLFEPSPKLSQKRIKRVYLKRTAQFYGAFVSNIRDVLEAPFRNINGLYVGGIREVLTVSHNLEKFAGIIPNKATLREADTLKAINALLGERGLATGYEIRYSRGITDNEIETLKKKLKRRAFPEGELYSNLLEQGLIHRYELYDTVTNTTVKRSEVGLGIIQVLPILANMAAHENALLVIEQPELHLHPAQQSKLAQLVVKNYQEHGNRFMIETHSEHFIKTVQLEIARGKSQQQNVAALKKEDVQILYVDKDKKRGGSFVREIKLTDEGSFSEPWPDNFFEASADITLERLRLINKN